MNHLESTQSCNKSLSTAIHTNTQSIAITFGEASFMCFYQIIFSKVTCESESCCAKYFFLFFSTFKDDIQWRKIIDGFSLDITQEYNT